ncbi:MAG: sensor histidine kinase, partial [Mangrovibacterium sp.]
MTDNKQQINSVSSPSPLGELEGARKSFLENLIYLVIWSIILIAPLFDRLSNETLNWSRVFAYWAWLVPFFALFLLNNFLLIPRLLLRKKTGLYLLVNVFLLALLFASSPSPAVRHDFKQKPHFEEGFHPPKMYDKNFHPKQPRIIHAPFGFGPAVDNLILAVLIIGFNIAIRLLFKSIRDEQQIKELKSQSLRAELDYLKAQVNPHFFMNTLNNIHALIDIDTDRAKDTVIELSKIMRYVLYDANRPLISLEKEIHFLDNYIRLMRIRYTDNLDIRTSYPEEIP